MFNIVLYDTDTETHFTWSWYVTMKNGVLTETIGGTKMLEKEPCLTTMEAYDEAIQFLSKYATKNKIF